MKLAEQLLEVLGESSEDLSPVDTLDGKPVIHSSIIEDSIKESKFMRGKVSIDSSPANTKGRSEHYWADKWEASLVIKKNRKLTRISIWAKDGKLHIKLPTQSETAYAEKPYNPKNSVGEQIKEFLLDLKTKKIVPKVK